MKCALQKEEIISLVAQYDSENDDTEAFKAGRRIRDGAYTLGNLITIAEWKLERAPGNYYPCMARIRKSDPVQVAKALRFSTSTSNRRLAIEILDEIDGIAVRVASAIMTTIHPDRFTIIDVHALRELGEEKQASRPDTTVDFYLKYLDFCLATAAKLGVSLRDLDKALWQKDVNRANRSPCK